jgi:hypothetical protein
MATTKALRCTRQYQGPGLKELAKIDKGKWQTHQLQAQIAIAKAAEEQRQQKVASRELSIRQWMAVNATAIIDGIPLSRYAIWRQYQIAANSIS